VKIAILSGNDGMMKCCEEGLGKELGHVRQDMPVVLLGSVTCIKDLYKFVDL
jgi:hypothetical protein